MTAINSSGFDPDIHLAKPSDAVARVKSANYPGSSLYLSEEGAVWARALIEEQPYYRKTWTLESKH